MMHKASCTAIALLGFTSLNVRAVRKKDREQYATLTDSAEQLQQTNPNSRVYMNPDMDFSALPPGSEMTFTVACNDEFQIKGTIVGFHAKVALQFEGMKDVCRDKADMFVNFNEYELEKIAFEDSVTFGIFDKDKNQQLSESEFLSPFEPLMAALSIPEDQVKLNLGLIFAWLDKDNDKQINKDEIRSAMTYLVKLTDPVFLVTELADFLFKTLDGDTNDRITREELKKLGPYLPADAEFVDWLLLGTTADSNKDGELSKTEFDVVVDWVKKVVKDPALLLDLVTPDALLELLDEDISGSVSKVELLQLPKRLPVPLDEDQLAAAELALTTHFDMFDPNGDGVLDKDEISGVLNMIKPIVRSALVSPPVNVCMSKKGDNLVMAAPVPGQPDKILEFKREEKCEKDEKVEKDGVPRSAGFAALMVARLIAF